ncbi:unnamed protein product [Gulo gulo]|uniref:Uncharacterized protein n=1 Tax=Gulo gulo TaxID=48420 RepID=A0A9X9PVM9_GULGU|nr:unnamed protein product [Gulo gulo]
MPSALCRACRHLPGLLDCGSAAPDRTTDSWGWALSRGCTRLRGLSSPPTGGQDCPPTPSEEGQ